MPGLPTPPGDVQPCSSCGSAAHREGRLPDSNLFAGRSLSDILPGGWLYRCGACGLGFRHPRLAKDALDRLYAAGSDGAWTAEAAHRADWLRAAELAADCGAARVLDIGCYDGGFLGSLGANVEKHGIEIHPGAAAAAKEKGVHIVGRDFAALATLAPEYDVATAFDVLEHVEDPLDSLARFAAVLRPGGTLIVSTGNRDAWTWTLMRSRYWYCAIPEHISFLSVRWFEYAALSLSLRLASVWRYAHANARWTRKMFETAANVAYLVAPSAIGALRRRGIGHASAGLAPELVDDYPPGWLSARDHVLVAFIKP